MSKSKLTLSILTLTFLLKLTHQGNIAGCSLCKNKTSLLDADTGIERHISEATVTKNCNYVDKYQIIQDRFCKGTIFGPYNILTSASCFNSTKKYENYCVYVRYLHVKDTIPFLKLLINNVMVHPRYYYNYTEYDVAVIKLKNSIEFDDIYCSRCNLPDDLIDTDNFEDNDCYISGYVSNTKGLQTFSVKVEVLEYDECMDIAAISKVDISMNEMQYCVLSQRPNQNATLHVNGKGVVCKNIVAGLMTKWTYNFEGSTLFQILDVGRHSTWARSVMLNLRSTDQFVFSLATLSVTPYSWLLLMLVPFFIWLK